MRRAVSAIVILVALFSVADVGAQRGAPARIPDADSPKNDPEGAGAVAKVAKDFKGTHDIAGAAEALINAAGPKFTYDYGFDVQNPLYTGLTGVKSLNQFFAQRLLVCYEFVHYVAFLAGNQRVSSTGTPQFVGSDISVWDKDKFSVHWMGDVPRGKIVIFKSWLAANSGGYFHVAISLGNNRYAHMSSNGNVKISSFSEISSLAYYGMWVGDYPWEKNLDTKPAPKEGDATAAPAEEPEEKTTDKPADKPADKTIDKPAAKPDDKPAEKAPETRGSTGLRDALDASPAGIRLADRSSCCGDPLGQKVATTAAAPKPQYQMLITGGGIDRKINNYSPPQPDQSPLAWVHNAASAVSWLWRGSIVYAAQGLEDGVSVSLIATGRSSGDAMRVAMKTPADYSGWLLASDAMVLEATSATAAVPLEGSRPGLDVSRLQAYCAQFVKLPPSAGTVYRVASDAIQSKFRPMRKLLRAADALHDAGRLHPDSEPGGYLTFVKQYALWTALEGWNAGEFESHLIEKARDAAAAAGQKWTREAESMVKKAAPGRWADVQQVIMAAR